MYGLACSWDFAKKAQSSKNSLLGTSVEIFQERDKTAAIFRHCSGTDISICATFNYILFYEITARSRFTSQECRHSRNAREWWIPLKNSVQPQQLTSILLAFSLSLSLIFSFSLVAVHHNLNTRKNNLSCPSAAVAWPRVYRKLQFHIVFHACRFDCFSIS